MQASLKSKLEAKVENIEKVLIIIFFFSILIKFFVSGLKTIATYTAPGSLIVLSLVYLILSEKIYKLFFLALLIGILAPMFAVSGAAFFNFGSAGAVSIFGIFVLIRAIKESLRNKTFELLPFLLGFLLSIRVAISFITYYYPKVDIDQIYNLYFFGLTFIIGTIIYNDNFWERYNLSEKKAFLFLLVVALGNVLSVSLKYL
ncbi:MAG TPA: hypothetical protein VIK89_03340 [Cytophagaceae bacterium]